MSELVAPSKVDQGGRALQLGDIAWEDSGVRISLRVTKTDQLARGQDKTWFTWDTGWHCPCLALQMYLAVDL